MNRAEVLESTVDFMVASHEYVTLIQRTFIEQGRLKEAISALDVQRIAYAREKVAGLEQQMLTAWRDNGIG